MCGRASTMCVSTGWWGVVMRVLPICATPARCPPTWADSALFWHLKECGTPPPHTHTHTHTPALAFLKKYVVGARPICKKKWE